MTFLLDHLHPACFGAVIGALIVGACVESDLRLVCAAAGIAGLAAFAVFGALPLAYLSIRKH